jgi:hypothetical protein
VFDVQGVPERIRGVDHGRQNYETQDNPPVGILVACQIGSMCSRSDSSGLGGLVPGGISISLGRLHLSAMPKDGMGGYETNPRRIDSHPCNLDPRACRESVNRMGSCARSSRTDPVVLFSGQSRLEEW